MLIPLTEHGFGVGVTLCGCPRACGDKKEFKARARHHLLIAGESVNGSATPQKHLTETVQKGLENILNQYTYEFPRP
ncbi:MAG: hypothetical protein FJZ85_03080 [Chloroflexi bacterium]|nr:hypothetical protein [Chloroflexota bacterium]MBM3175323.1 hypothetical protein [Chloroflexota bacterium]MBM4451031.1 hypothetical protein [Chloroflexota bacterium]MBM4454189.1 hypothetical protein [Chloroflexota bacterium]